jgi:hypothetical protein
MNEPTYHEHPAAHTLPHTAEFGSKLYRDNAEVDTIMLCKMALIVTRITAVTMNHHSGGYRLAGSCGGRSLPRYSVTWQSERGREGRQLKSFEKARAFYASFQDPALA